MYDFGEAAVAEALRGNNVPSASLQEKLNDAEIFGHIEYSVDDLVLPDFRIPVGPRNISGIYFLFNDDALVYIGQSKNIAARISAHASGSIAFDSYSYIECISSRLNELEALYTFKFKPLLNVHGDGRPKHSSVVGALKSVMLDGGLAYDAIPQRGNGMSAHERRQKLRKLRMN